MKLLSTMPAITAAFLLAGCAVGPDYHSPKADAPTDWSTAQLGGATNSTVQIIQWWQTFNDSELNSLIERAVKQNHDLRIAEARLREARALRGGALWDLGPAMDAKASYTDARTSKNAQAFSFKKINTDLYDAQFDATWEIDVFGAKRRALEAATRKLPAAPRTVATCWSVCSLKSRAIMSRSVARSDGSSSPATTSSRSRPRSN